MNDGKFEGVTGWDAETTTLKTAILRSGGKELAVDFDFDGYKFTATLMKNENGRYEGAFTRQNGGEKYVGNTSCKLFEDGDGVILFGRWHEEGSIYTWWAELQPLD